MLIAHRDAAFDISVSDTAQDAFPSSLWPSPVIRLSLTFTRSQTAIDFNRLILPIG